MRAWACVYCVYGTRVGACLLRVCCAFGRVFIACMALAWACVYCVYSARVGVCLLHVWCVRGRVFIACMVRARACLLRVWRSRGCVFIAWMVRAWVCGWCEYGARWLMRVWCVCGHVVMVRMGVYGVGMGMYLLCGCVVHAAQWLIIFAADRQDTPSYKKYEQLQHEGNMSFGENSDGLSLYKTSNKSIWPTFLINYNLPPSSR